MRRALSLLLSGLLLAGCVMQSAPMQSLSVLEGAAVVQGPAGYCIDGEASRPDTGFAVMASCAAIAGQGNPPMVDGLLTVQVGVIGSAAVNSASTQIASLMRTPGGARMLSAAGNPASVEVENVDRAEGLVVVRFRDAASPAIAGLDSREFRAFLDVRGRLTTVSFRFYQRAPGSVETGNQLLAQAVATLRAANAAP